MFEQIEAWLKATAWPKVKTFFSGVATAEVDAVVPVAEKQLTTLSQDELTAVTSGNSKNTGHILATVVSGTVTELENAGIQAGVSSILTGIGAAIAGKSTS